MAVAIEQQLVRLHAVAFPLIEFFQALALTHADLAVAVFAVGFGGVDHVATLTENGVAVQAGAGGFFFQIDLLRHLAVAVTT